MDGLGSSAVSPAAASVGRAVAWASRPHGLRLDPLLLVDRAAVAHRLVLGGVSFESGPARATRPILTMQSFCARVRRLGEQVREGVQVTGAEPRHRAEVRGLVSGQEPERDVVGALALDRPRGERTPVGSRRPAGAASAADRRAGSRACRCSRPGPAPGPAPRPPGRRRTGRGGPEAANRPPTGQQQGLMRVEHPRPLVHPGRTVLRLLLLDRLDLEQSTPSGTPASPRTKVAKRRRAVGYRDAVLATGAPLRVTAPRPTTRPSLCRVSAAGRTARRRQRRCGIRSARAGCDQEVPSKSAAAPPPVTCRSHVSRPTATL